MTSKAMRESPLFMRNSFHSVGKWGIPLVKKQVLPSANINLVACSDTRAVTMKKIGKMEFISLLMITASKASTIILNVP